MRIVLLTGEGNEHCYVANKLSSEIHLSAIVLDRGKKKNRMERLRSLLKRYSFAQLFSRVIGKLISTILRDDNRKEIEMLRVLGDKNSLLMAGETPVIYIDGCNTEKSIARIRDLQPDVLLVYGTGIIGDTVLGIPFIVTLNMHTGISPYYRGTGCAFWPLYNNEPHMIGATIHQCTAEIDGGKIYAVKEADLDADDTLFSMFPRSVKTGAELYVEVVKQLVQNGKIDGARQDPKIGHEYKASRKSWWKELVVRRRIRRGLIRDYVMRGHQSFGQQSPYVS